MSATKRDYYEVLGVQRDASADDIKRAYRRLAMKHHPDRADGDKTDSEAKFKEAAEAYEVLSDDAKRRRYDQFGFQGVSGQHDFSHMDVGDIFSMFEDIFAGPGGGRRRGRQQPSRGYDVEVRIELTLDDVADGAEKKIEFERQDRCAACGGSGARAGVPPVVCGQCGGQGRVVQQGFGGMFRMIITCPNCQGRGAVVKQHCPDCGGQGRVLRQRTVMVKIPPGVHEGQAVRVIGEGEPAAAPTAPPGDLHVYIGLRQHPIFTRHNNDLVCQAPVLFTEAALGATIEVPTLKGSEKLEIPAGSQHGDVFKLKGKGLPDVRTHRTGDELVQITIEVPRKLNDRQKFLLNEFAATEEARIAQQRKGILGKLKDLIT